MKRFDCHVHTHKSNIQHRDSTNFESGIIDRAIELGLKGIALTDHAVLSSHVDAIKHLEKLKKETPDLDFKLGLGTEIYLVDRDKIAEARKNNESTSFYHLIVVAKNYNGYRAIAELSSNAWEEAFTYRGVMRVPTYKDYFTEWASRNAGDVIITTACLGSEFSRMVLNYAQTPSEDNKMAISNFILWFKSTFGDDFYIEIQPSFFEEQIVYNKLAMQIANAYNIKVVINTDAHFDRLEMKEIHSIYLKSQNAERETEQFYASAYLMDVEELRTYFDYIDDCEFEKYMNNSLEIERKIESFDLFKATVVPHTTIPYLNGINSIIAPLVINNEKYKNIINYGTSDEVVDRILLQQIEIGLKEKNITLTTEVLNRLEVELEALWEVSKGLGQRMAGYYLLTKEIVELMWLVSIVGVSRGSAGSFYICYLLGITQINPMEYELDYWRHIDKNKIELADIDLDSESGQRANILELVKEKYGHDKVLNICTFKTEGTASAIQTMCRGMGIPTEEAQYISSLAVDGLTIKKCLELYEKDKEATILIKEMMNYEDLVENVIAIEGLVCGRSVHASGVYIFNEEYHKCNAMMRTPNGQMVTQYDMFSSDYQGGLKLDFLTVEALDRLKKGLNILIEDGVIESQGTLKKTYDKYLHPDKLDLKNKEMWSALCKGEILDAFQMDSPVGKSSIAKVMPQNFIEACATNSLMRISCEGKQPIDRFNENKKNIQNWYFEMREAGLTSTEVRTMEKHLLKTYGVASTQEQAMKLSMDSNIANFDLIEANKLRKAIAKSYAKNMIEEIYNKFIDKGISSGNRQGFLEYVWDSCIVPMLGYSFSDPHIFGYTLILLQEMNLYMLSPLHWNVACLCVNSGDINDEVTKSTDYGALAKAIGNMEKGFIKPPSINTSARGFKANLVEQNALYGLGAINGISSEIVEEIINTRPYNSLEDFMIKMIDTKKVQPSKMFTLIKAGCFNEFGLTKTEAMVRFINHIVPNKTKLTTANIPKMIEFGVIDENLEKEVTLYNFKKIVFDKKNFKKAINKTQGWYKIPKNVESFFNESLMSYFISALEYDEDGSMILNSKEFDNQYKKLTIKLTEWLKSKDALDRINYCYKNEVWIKYCYGSQEKWEMDSISYYTDRHELDEIDISAFYTLDNFNNLARTPKKKMVINKKTGREYNRNELNIIAGTVVQKNKMKSIVTLNTQYGVVDVKYNRNTFSNLDRKTTEEDGWFKRGTKLIIIGYRREESFVPKVYHDSKFISNTIKIEKDDLGRVTLKDERIVVEE